MADKQLTVAFRGGPHDGKMAKIQMVEPGTNFTTPDGHVYLLENSLTAKAAWAGNDDFPSIFIPGCTYVGPKIREEESHRWN